MGKFTPKIPPAPPPPKPEFVDVIDEVNGVQTKYVTDPDGKKTAVQSRLPLSEEEQAAIDNLKRIENESLERIEALSNAYDLTEIESLVPGITDTLNNYRETNKRIISDSFKETTRLTEKGLARAGIEDSTAATELRNQQSEGLRESFEQLGREEQSLQEQIRQREMAEAQGLFGIATQRGDVALNRLASASQTAAQNSAGLSNMATNVGLAAHNSALNQQNLQFQANQAGLGNLAGIVGTAAGFGLGGGFGGLVGGGSGSAIRAGSTAGRNALSGFNVAPLRTRL